MDTQRTGAADVPADYRDPNHPLAPANTEMQVSNGNFKWKKKRICATVTGVAVVLVVLVAAFLIGMEVSRNRPQLKLQQDIANTTSTIIQWSTIKPTSIATSTSIETPSLAISTKWVTITPIVFAPPGSMMSTRAIVSTVLSVAPLRPTSSPDPLTSITAP